jgi:hypothetical protein
MKSSFFRSG